MVTTGGDGIGLPLAVRDQVQAVVFDANAFGRGRPELEQLRYLAGRLAELGVETWVPEPVAWEWAQHLAEDWDAVRVRLGEANKQLQKAALATFEVRYADAAAVADDFLCQLVSVPHVVVVPLAAEHALAGLRDQVLQRPPGSRKHGVKTGSSDSAWMRQVLERADDDPGHLVFASADADLPAALRAWGHAAPLMRPLKDLLATFYTVTVDTGDAARVVMGPCSTPCRPGNAPGFWSSAPCADSAPSWNHSSMTAGPNSAWKAPPSAGSPAAPESSG